MHKLKVTVKSRGAGRPGDTGCTITNCAPVPAPQGGCTITNCQPFEPQANGCTVTNCGTAPQATGCTIANCNVGPTAGCTISDSVTPVPGPVAEGKVLSPLSRS